MSLISANSVKAVRENYWTEQLQGVLCFFINTVVLILVSFGERLSFLLVTDIWILLLIKLTWQLHQLLVKVVEVISCHKNISICFIISNMCKIIVCLCTLQDNQEWFMMLKFRMRLKAQCNDMEWYGDVLLHSDGLVKNKII